MQLCEFPVLECLRFPQRAVWAQNAHSSTTAKSKVNWGRGWKFLCLCYKEFTSQRALQWQSIFFSSLKEYKRETALEFVCIFYLRREMNVTCLSDGLFSLLVLLGNCGVRDRSTKDKIWFWELVHNNYMQASIYALCLLPFTFRHLEWSKKIHKSFQLYLLNFYCILELPIVLGNNTIQ